MNIMYSYSQTEPNTIIQATTDIKVGKYLYNHVGTDQIKVLELLHMLTLHCWYVKEARSIILIVIATHHNLHQPQSILHTLCCF